MVHFVVSETTVLRSKSDKIAMSANRTFVNIDVHTDKAYANYETG